MIGGRTKLIAHVGYPTESFRSPAIYNPWFARHGVDAVVVPMGCKGADFPTFLRLLFRLSNIGGALVTMPHKVTTLGLLDEVLPTARVAGACNAVRLGPEGQLVGDMFDGEGFVRCVPRKGRRLRGARALVVGSGGVGSAIAASLAGAGVAELSLFDVSAPAMERLAGRLEGAYPALAVSVGSNDPSGFDLVVNATPMGMSLGDPLPVDATRLDPGCLVGEVVLSQEITPFLAAARERGCAFTTGLDMLFEQIPAYLDFFGWPGATAEELRAGARLPD